MTSAASRSRTVHARPVLVVALLALLAACAAAEASTGADRGLVAAPAAGTAEPEAGAQTAAGAGSAAPTATTGRPGVAPRLQVALRSAAGWQGRATYVLTSTGGTSATVTLARRDDQVRLDVTMGDATSTLLGGGGSGAWVACQSTDHTSCVVAAPAGAALPDAFDPGLAQLLFTSLPALADRGMGVADAGWISAVYDTAGHPVASAACAQVLGRHAGQYCLTEAGLLRRAVLPSGTLELTTAEPAADPAVFTPAATPVPLA